MGVAGHEKVEVGRGDEGHDQTDQVVVHVRSWKGGRRGNSFGFGATLHSFRLRHSLLRSWMAVVRNGPPISQGS